MNTKLLCRAAIAIAMVFVITRFIQIPIPLGYFNIGNCVILLFCSILPLGYGVAMGSLGSALADLTSFPIYTLPTLLIKAAMPLVFYGFIRRKSSNKLAVCLGAYISMLIPLIGYTVTGMILYGGFEAGLAQVPGLVIEYIVNAVLFTVIIGPFKRIEKVLSD